MGVTGPVTPIVSILFSILNLYLAVVEAFNDCK